MRSAPAPNRSTTRSPSGRASSGPSCRERDRCRREARNALLIAAASDSGDLVAIARACGGSAAALDEGERAGLVEIRGEELSFRHPLVRSAVYSAATAGARREAHAALAEAFGSEDADRRAWHLGAAVIGPDEAIAAALDEAAERARVRGGMGAEARLAGALRRVDV